MRVFGVTICMAITSVAAAQPAPDLEHAKELYRSGELAMTEGRYADAIGDFGGVYEITRDPVVFFKIGSANEKAGKCDVALIYYGRYLREAKPAPKYVALTEERIAACGGDPHAGTTTEPARPADTAPPGPSSSMPSSATPGPSTSTGASSSPPGPSSPTPAPSSSTPAPSASSPGPSSSTSAATVSAHAAATPPGPDAHPAIGGHRAAWVLVSGSLTFATIGAVLAYSANAAENDVADLYIGLDGRPPAFDARTQKTYDQLLVEGRRYEVLSWVSFAAAGAAAIGATVLYLHDRSTEGAQRTVIVPTVAPGSAGVTAILRF